MLPFSGKTQQIFSPLRAVCNEVPTDGCRDVVVDGVRDKRYIDMDSEDSGGMDNSFTQITTPDIHIFT